MMFSAFKSILSILLLVVGICLVVAQEPAWHRGPPLVFAKSSAVSVGSKVIFFNGKVGGVDIYDSLSDTWSVGPPLRAQSAGGYSITAVTVGEKVIFAGGQLDDYSSTAAVDIYDASTDSWSHGASLPDARAFYTAAAVSGKAVFIGNPFPQFLALAPRIYAAENNSWSSGPSIARGRSSDIAAATAGTSVIVLGGSGAGSSFSSPSSAVDIYNSIANEWREGAALPSPYVKLAATEVDGRAFFAGGYVQVGVEDELLVPVLEPAKTVFIYNGTGDRWSEIAVLPSANGSALAVTLGRSALFINGDSRAMDIYTASSNSWSSGPSLVAFASSVASASNNSAVAIGNGITQLYRSRPSSVVSPVNCPSNSWIKQPSIPFVPSTVAAVGNKTIFPRSDVITSAIFNPNHNGTSADAWRDGPSSVGQASLAVTIGPRAYFLTSLATDHYLQIYNPADGTVREMPFILSNYSFSAAAAAGQKAIFASDFFRVFDTDSKRWTTGPATGRVAAVAATSVGTKAIFAGGLSRVSATDRVDIYDSATASFSSGPALPGGARYFMAATSVGTKALFVGGQKQIGTSASSRPIFGASDAVDIYDSATGTWSSGPALAGGARFAIVALTVGTKAIFAGGFNGSVASTAVDIFDSVTNTWTRGAPLLEGGTGLAAALNSTAGLFVISDVVQLYKADEQICNETSASTTAPPDDNTTALSSPPATETSAGPSATPTSTAALSPSPSPTLPAVSVTPTATEGDTEGDESSASAWNHGFLSLVLLALLCAQLML